MNLSVHILSFSEGMEPHDPDEMLRIFI